MSGTFKTAGGETWSIVSMQTTGSDLAADRIRMANSSYVEPIPAGVTLSIPDDPRTSSSVYPEKLQVKVWGENLEMFDRFSFSTAIDAIAKGSFSVPNVKDFRDIFVPIATPEIEVSSHFNLLLTGRCSSPGVNSSDSEQTLDIGFWSTPAILETSGPPIGAFPLEYKNMNLAQIASDLCWRNSIPTEFDGDVGATFERVSIQPGSGSLSFLADLAKQRGFVISCDPKGALIFRTGTKIGSPIMEIEKGIAPCISIKPTFSEESYYSEVTGYIPRKSNPAYRGGQGFTVKNPHVTDIIRPHLQEFPDIEPAELETAVWALAGRMFAGVFSLDVELATWTDDNGDLISENKTVMIKSPSDYVEKWYEFLIAGVTLAKVSGSETCSLILVLPGVYSGEIPEVLPWQR